MGKYRLLVPENEHFQNQGKNLTKTKTVELELSTENERRFHATPDQLLVYAGWKLSGTALSFDQWLSKQNWDSRVNKFIIPIV